MLGEVAIAVVIENDRETRNRMSSLLRQTGYSVHEEGSGRNGVALARSMKPDVVVVGFGLPDIDGVETVRRLYATVDSYLLAVLESIEEIDLVLALESGADGYCHKPLRDREFRALVDSFMRRRCRVEQSFVQQNGQTHQALSHGPLKLDPSSWEVHLDGELVGLTATEFELLRLMMQPPGRVRSKKELVQRVKTGNDGHEHGYVSEADVRSIEVHVANLRRKLGDSARSSQWIETVRGVGYRLVNNHSSP